MELTKSDEPTSDLNENNAKRFLQFIIMQVGTTTKTIYNNSYNKNTFQEIIRKNLKNESI